MLVAPRELVLQFRQAVGSAGVAWYHVMRVRGYDALAGTLPTIEIRTPSTAVRGTVQFTGQGTTESTYGACRTTRTNGAATGSLQTTFAGWGARALRLTPSVTASYSQTN